MSIAKYFKCSLVNTEKMYSPARYGCSIHIEDIGFIDGPNYDDYYDVYKCFHVFLWRYEIYLGVCIDWKEYDRQRG